MIALWNILDQHHTGLRQVEVGFTIALCDNKHQSAQMLMFESSILVIYLRSAD